MIELIPLGYLIDIALAGFVLWVLGKPLLIHCWKWWCKTVNEQKRKVKK